MLLEKILKVVPANVNESRVKNVDNFLGRSTKIELKRTLLYCLRSKYFIENMCLTEEDNAENFLNDPQKKDIKNGECGIAIILFLYNKKFFTGKKFLEDLIGKCSYVKSSMDRDSELEIDMLDLSRILKNNVNEDNLELIDSEISSFEPTYALKLRKIKSFEKESELVNFMSNNNGIRMKTVPVSESREQFVLRLIMFCRLCELTESRINVNRLAGTWPREEKLFGIGRKMVNPSYLRDIETDTRNFFVFIRNVDVKDIKKIIFEVIFPVIDETVINFSINTELIAAAKALNNLKRMLNNNEPLDANVVFNFENKLNTIVEDQSYEKLTVYTKKAIEFGNISKKYAETLSKNRNLDYI